MVLEDDLVLEDVARGEILLDVVTMVVITLIEVEDTGASDAVVTWGINDASMSNLNVIIAGISRILDVSSGRIELLVDCILELLDLDVEVALVEEPVDVTDDVDTCAGSVLYFKSELDLVAEVENFDVIDVCFVKITVGATTFVFV